MSDSTAIIEYVLGEDSLVYVFYIDQQTFLFELLPIQQKALNKYIRQLHSSLTNYEAIFKKRDKNPPHLRCGIAIVSWGWVRGDTRRLGVGNFSRCRPETFTDESQPIG